MPPSTPELEEHADDVRCDQVICLDHLRGGGEWLILFGGLGGTVLVLMFASFSRIQAKLRPMDILSVLIAAADAFTDVAFTVQQLGTMESSFDYVTGSLLLVFLVLPTVCGAYQIALALRSPLLDTRRMQELSGYFAFVLLVALTNMEVLRVLPWQAGSAMFDGLPDRRMMMRVWLTVVFLEDIPQFCLQLIVTVNAGGSGLLAPVSLTFTMAALLWRGLRKCIYLLPVASSHEVSLAVNASRGAATPADSAPQSGMPSEANTQEGEEDALHLVLELEEQQRRQREYEGRRLAARLQEVALKEEQEREVMQEHKEKQEEAVWETEALGRTESEFNRETEQAIELSLSEAQKRTGSIVHHAPWHPEATDQPLTRTLHLQLTRTQAGQRFGLGRLPSAPAVVSSVGAGSLAEAAGFRVGDTILSMSSTHWGPSPIQVEDPADLRAGRNLLDAPAPFTCTVTVARNAAGMRTPSCASSYSSCASEPADNGATALASPRRNPNVVV